MDFLRGYDLFAERTSLTDRWAQLLNRKVEVVPEHELSRDTRENVLREADEL